MRKIKILGIVSIIIGVCGGYVYPQPLSQISPKFIPDISFIVDMTLEIKQENVEKGNPFNLNYGEIFLTSAVDPFFDLWVTIPFEEEKVELEETFIITRGLPFGFQSKLGKFKSGFGKINVQHPHFWDFPHLPLVIEELFGEEGLNNLGIQLTWLLPTPFYLLFGFEVANENIKVGFLKNSFDLQNLTTLWGLSYILKQDTIWGFDIKSLYQLSTYRHFYIQGEYYKGKNAGHGYYAQLVVRHNKYVRYGIQHNKFQEETKNLISLELNPSEFSRVRLQYALEDKEILVQLNFSIGAHGAHPF